MFKSIFSGHKRLLVTLAILMVFAGGSGAVWVAKNRANTDSSPEARKPTINYTPGTATEKKETEDNKDRIVNEQQQTPASSSDTGNKKTVTPIITSSTGSVRGSVNGIFEEGGTCTATFKKSDTTLTRTSAGFQNVSYTQCAPIAINDGFLSPGTWSVTLSYSSATAEGTSQSQTVEVN